MNKTERLFHVVEALRAARRPITANTIAADFGVSPRTIYRDIKLLITQGLPIMGEAGVGYKLADDFDAPPLGFTQDELEVLSIGLRIAYRDGDAAMRKAADAAFAKIKGGLKDSSTFDSIALFAPSMRTPEGPALLSQVRSAIRNKVGIGFKYTALSGTVTKRQIKPLALLFFKDATLIAGYCDMREDFRNFRIDRIEDYAETGERFKNIHYRLIRDYYASLKKERGE
jgi:predicted DNA-binding transcriptional regulator YafY